MPLQLTREGIPQCKLMANRNEMVATWRKYRIAKIQDEKFVMKKATERASNFASYQKKKDKFYTHHSFPWIKFHSLVEENDQ